MLSVSLSGLDPCLRTRESERPPISTHMKNLCFDFLMKLMSSIIPKLFSNSAAILYNYVINYIAFMIQVKWLSQVICGEAAQSNIADIQNVLSLSGSHDIHAS